MATASSEETPTEDPMGGQGFSVAFDPLVRACVRLVCAVHASPWLVTHHPQSINQSINHHSSPPSLQDGSSIIDTNFAVGTIFGVWPGSRLTGISGRQLAASGIANYGPRTTITLAVNSAQGAHEFLLVDDFSARHGSWVHIKTFDRVE